MEDKLLEKEELQTLKILESKKKTSYYPSDS